MHQTLQATIFCEPPIITSPKEAYCWTVCSRFVNLGPKHLLFPVMHREVASSSAVSFITSFTVGGEARVEVLKESNSTL